MATDTLTRTKTHTFTSIGASLTLIRTEPEVRYVQQGGTQRAMIDKPGLVYGTQDGTAQLLSSEYKVGSKVMGTSFSVEEGQDVLPDGPDGEPQDAVQWLRGHDLYRSRFYEHDVEVPSSDDVMEQIAIAAANRDEDRLVEIQEIEAANWNRQQVIEAAHRTLLALRPDLAVESEGEPEAPPVD